ncbi:O-phosphoseryl-tRNA(Sec) selenium transferase [Trinorchestia longiramus]|nr:O-phosphoseryl-tRNA(Sec) selenium transferase [Trinorchestia longiramus]
MSESFKLADAFVPQGYLTHAIQSSQQSTKLLNVLLRQGKIPDKGWSDAQIEQLLQQLSNLDSNNFTHNVGVGEREARIYSNIVRARHYGLGHGIGRSGDLCASQPKAVGSSLLYNLTSSMAKDAVKAAGLPSVSEVVVLPCATGAALLLCLSSLAEVRPDTELVVWLRCDQRSCFKAIYTAGLEPVVVEGVLAGDEVLSDVGAVQSILAGPQCCRVRAVITTTSCFAPRAADDVVAVASLCHQYGVPHVINNAYGLQSTKLMHNIKEAARCGRVDIVIQSTDKNFMVPVGGALACTFDQPTAKRISAAYPGRASISPVMDLFITLLSMGKRRFVELTKERNVLKIFLDAELQTVAQRHDLRLLSCPCNPISSGLALPSVVSSRSATALGAMLFTRGVSGARVVPPGKLSSIGRTEFVGWGGHHSRYPVAYLTASASIGMTQADVINFITRLDRCLVEWKKKEAMQYSGASLKCPQPKVITAAAENCDDDEENSDGLLWGDANPCPGSTQLTEVDEAINGVHESSLNGSSS